MVALGTNIQPCTLSYIAKYSSSDIGVCRLVSFTVLEYGFQEGKRIKTPNFSLLMPFIQQYHSRYIISKVCKCLTLEEFDIFLVL